MYHSTDNFISADAECRLARLERLCRARDAERLRSVYEEDIDFVEDALCDILDMDALRFSQYGLHGMKAGEDDDWRFLMPS